MKKFIKEFLLSSAFIWVFYILLIQGRGLIHTKEALGEVIMIASLLLPIAMFFVIVIPAIYVSLIFKKNKNRLLKSFFYFCLSWVLFGVMVSVTSPVALWIQNQVYFGGQGEEQKQALVAKAEKSLEKKLNKDFKLVESEYRNEGSFSDMAFSLIFKEEGNKKNYPATMVYLSYEQHGWRMKIINGDIWYIEK
ncbi:hypothetical protein U8V72_17650 [Priestia filamentosa]|uniref:hypothetical protein n=1 Tax=Priestia filamentosa TaxID=1402861 RepID=UPI0039796D96